MTEAVPANLFPDDSDPCKSRSNALLENAVRTDGLVSFEPGGGNRKSRSVAYGDCSRHSNNALSRDRGLYLDARIIHKGPMIYMNG